MDGCLPACRMICSLHGMVKDDKLTVISISVIACVLQDVLHEGLGHGVTAWLSGANQLTISTVALQCDIDTRWISANGTLVNLLFGAVFWVLLLRPQRYSPAARYFLLMAMAGNLFTGTGYFFFSGVTNYGDWAAVIRGLQPHWMWQIALVGIGVVSYYASMLVVAAQLRAFRGPDDGPLRLRVLCWTPYVTDGILAGLGGLLNPLGLLYVVTSALPSTLGANAGLWSLPSMVRTSKPGEKDQVEPISRSPVWIAAGAVASLLFIVVLGRGLTWSR